MRKLHCDTSTRNTFLAFLALLFFLGSLLEYIILQKIIYPNFVSLEEREVARQIQRVENGISDLCDNLDTLCHDWSAWDDSYFYMDNLAPDFEGRNLTITTLKNAGLNLILFFSVQGEVVCSREIDLQTGDEVTKPGFPTEKIPVELFDLLTEHHGVPLNQAVVSGLYSVDEKIYLVSCHPILTSQGMGPIKGYVLMAKLFSPVLRAELHKKIKVDFTVHQKGMDKSGLLSPKAYQPADLSIYLDPVAKDTLYGLTELSGIDGLPALTVKIAMPREITRQGARTIRTTIIVNLVLAGLSICLIFFIYDFLVHRPLLALSRHAREISHESDFSRRLDVKNFYFINSEIDDLAHEFNHMLDAIEFYYAQLDDINSQQDLEITRREKIEKELLETQKKLKMLVRLDGLTRIGNRRLFDTEYSRQWRAHFRNQQPLALIICDVDHFKFYNDTYGHPAGDSCLKKVARILTEWARRPSDLAARYGGEEFVVLLPETPAAGAATVAEKIRLSVEKCNIEHSSSPVASHVTLSLGVAALIPGKNMEPQELIDLADRALYQAKEEGRNRVVVSLS